MIRPGDWAAATTRFGPTSAPEPRRWPRIRALPMLALMAACVASVSFAPWLAEGGGAPLALVVAAVLAAVAVHAVRQLRSADYEAQREGRVLLVFTLEAAGFVAALGWILR